MSLVRLTLAAAVLGMSAPVAQADVQVVGPVEYGLFETTKEDFQPGERVLTRRDQSIRQTTEIPAKLGSKFGLRYRLVGGRFIGGRIRVSGFAFSMMQHATRSPLVFGCDC